MQTSRGILKKKITRKVTLLEIVSWCSLISLGWCWAVPLEESLLKSCTSKLGIIKVSGNSSLENNLYSLTIWLALGVKDPESKEPNLPYLPSIFSCSFLLISYWSMCESLLKVPNDLASWYKHPWVLPYPCEGTGSYDFFPVKSMWQKQWDVTSKMKLQKVCGFQLKHPLSFFYWLKREASCCILSFPMEKLTWQGIGISGQQMAKTWDLLTVSWGRSRMYPTAHQALRWLQLQSTPGL